MRESIYLFKQGFRPVWEDRRNVCGGAWTFRVPKASGPDVWTRVQLLAIGEKFESVLDTGTLLTRVSPLEIKTPNGKLTNANRRPALRRRPLRPLQLSQHHNLAPRLVKEEVGRRHPTVRP